MSDLVPLELAVTKSTNREGVVPGTCHFLFCPVSLTALPMIPTAMMTAGEAACFWELPLGTP